MTNVYKGRVAGQLTPPYLAERSRPTGPTSEGRWSLADSRALGAASHVMNLDRDAHGFVVLDRQACLERLAMHRVASLAITEHALPVVLPALYMLKGEDILVGASRTGILGRCLPDSVVSLCVNYCRSSASVWATHQSHSS